ncbi:MAG: CxxC-x17-CxxC domain-containing protein [Nanoarchaeota archaeon]
MHKTNCTDCGADCEVPFKPTVGKAVRCAECFRKSKDRR